MDDPKDKRKPIFRLGQSPGQWVIGSGKPTPPGKQATPPGKPLQPLGFPGRKTRGTSVTAARFGKAFVSVPSEYTAAIPQEPEEKKAKGFLGSLPGALGYPFVRGGKWSLIGGALFFAILELLLTFQVPVVRPLLSIFASVYLCAYVLKLVTSSASGDNVPPAWPAFADFWDDIVLPLLHVLGTGIVCFLAVGLCYLAAWYRLPVPHWAWWACWGFGLFYLPMSLLAVALFDSLAALDPLIVLRAIFRVFGAYLVTCIVLVLTAAVMYGFWERFVTFSIPYIPAYVSPYVVAACYGLLFLYCLQVATRVIGLLYVTRENRLGWFVVSRK